MNTDAARRNQDDDARGWNAQGGVTPGLRGRRPMPPFRRGSPSGHLQIGEDPEFERRCDRV